MGFLVVGVITILEVVFIRGMLTWLMGVAATIFVGSLNIIFSLKDKEFMQATLYLLTMVALCMGYFVLA